MDYETYFMASISLLQLPCRELFAKYLIRVMIPVQEKKEKRNAKTLRF